VTLETHPLGQTGLEVSRLGLGTVKFGRNQEVRYPNSFVLPSDQEIIDLLELAHSLGINLLDTAPAYGSSEQRIGRLLNNRADWVICTKVGEEFLKRLDVETHVSLIRIDGGGAAPKDRVAGKEHALLPVENTDAAHRMARCVDELQRDAT